MADVFGAVASTITLCEAATRGLGLVNDFLNAPREIAELQVTNSYHDPMACMAY